MSRSRVSAQGRSLRYSLALVAVGAAVFAFGPGPVERHGSAIPDVTPPEAGTTLIVDLIDGATDAQLQSVEAALGADLDWVHPLAIDEALAMGTVKDVSASVARLAGNPLIEVVEGDVLIEAFDYPNDPMYDKQWHLKAMGAPEGWASSARGRGVIVAVIDTGITKVEDLEGTKILPGATFVPGTSTAADDQGHGTHVAGTIAQTTNNGKGVAGVAPEATLLPVKVLSGMGFGSSAWIAAGIDYAVDEGADVINLSLGGGYSSVIHNAIKKANAKGVIVVAAAGNSGKRGVSWPGALEEAIGVSATGPDGTLAPYSSYGEGVDISAPGGDKRKAGGGVLQNTIDGRGGHHYVEYQGTSMATPHVVGAAAILLSQGLAPEAVERILLDSARSEGSWNEKYGHGQLDLAAALSHSGEQHGSTRFALGAIFALLISQLAATGRRFQLASATTAGVVAGGMFFLPMLPLPDVLLVQLLSAPLLSWPAVLGANGFAHFPLWLSAMAPAAIGFTLGAFRGSRWAAFGLACGIGAHLLHGAATNTLAPGLMPAALGNLWLVANATVCVILGLGLAGAEKLDEGVAR